jgi:hypothetical protein
VFCGKERCVWGVTEVVLPHATRAVAKNKAAQRYMVFIQWLSK